MQTKQNQTDSSSKCLHTTLLNYTAIHQQKNVQTQLSFSPTQKTICNLLSKQIYLLWRRTRQKIVVPFSIVQQPMQFSKMIMMRHSVAL